MTLKLGSLFAGYGGLDEGVRSVLGGEVAWHSEIDPGASKILAHRYPNVPNHGDITAIDWANVEPVDVLTGGFPCQDVSAAGKRAGIRPDTRSGLWTQFAYAIEQLGPRLVVIENVRGLLSADAHHPAHSDLEPCPWCMGEDGPDRPLRALGAVLGELADLGYDASWQGLRASDVGAPHGRFRVFIIAWPAADAAHDGRERRRPPRHGGHGPAHGSHAAADPGGGRREGRTERNQWPAGGLAAPQRDHADGRGDLAAHAEGSCVAYQPGGDDPRRAVVSAGARAGVGTGAGGPAAGVPILGGSAGVAWGPYADAVRRWERVTGSPAPAPTEPGSKGQPRLAPTFVEWMMGLPAGWVTDVPGLGRNQQLKALGNGVVPQQAAEALRILLPDVAAPPTSVEIGGAA